RYVVGFRPFGRQSFLAGGTVEIRTAPLAPIFRMGGGGEEGRQSKTGSQRFHTDRFNQAWVLLNRSDETMPRLRQLGNTGRSELKQLFAPRAVPDGTAGKQASHREHLRHATPQSAHPSCRNVKR